MAQTLGRLAIGVAMISMAITSTPAGAVPAPDSTQLAWMQSQCAHAPRVRIDARGAVFEGARPRISTEGIALIRERGRAALVTSVETRPTGPLLRWPEVERVQVLHPHVGRDVLIGTAVGLALAGSLAARASGPDLYESGDNGVLLVGTVLALLGGSAGLVIGMLDTHARTVYP